MYHHCTDVGYGYSPVIVRTFIGHSLVFVTPNFPTFPKHGVERTDNSSRRHGATMTSVLSVWYRSCYYTQGLGRLKVLSRGQTTRYYQQYYFYLFLKRSSDLFDQVIGITVQLPQLFDCLVICAPHTSTIRLE